MNKTTLIDGKKKPAKLPKVSAGRGGARPGAGRKEGVEVSNADYKLYNKARAKKTVHEAKLAEFEEREKSGELVEIELVQKEWQQILANVRAKLLALPTKLAAQVRPVGRRVAVSRISAGPSRAPERSAPTRLA